MAVDVKKSVIDLLRGTKAVTGEYGFGDFALDTDGLIDTVYEDDYTDAERETIRSNFATFDMNSFVRGEFVRSTKSLPCVCVARAGDDESDPMLGRGLGIASSQGSHFQAGRSRGSIHSESLRLEARAAGAMAPFVRDAIYHGMRWLLVQGMNYFHRKGVIAPMFVGGKDGDMPGEQEGHIIQMAQASLRYKVERKATRIVPRNGNAVRSNFEDHGGGVTPQTLIDRD
jgi:hypothetical protein